MASKTSKKSTKVAKKAVAKPVLLSGGNPQIAKADGDAPVQAYIAAMARNGKATSGAASTTSSCAPCPTCARPCGGTHPGMASRGQGWFVSLPRLHPLRKGDLPQWRVAASRPTRLRQGQGLALGRHLRRRARRGAAGDVDSAGGCPSPAGRALTGCERRLRQGPDGSACAGGGGLLANSSQFGTSRPSQLGQNREPSH